MSETRRGEKARGATDKAKTKRSTDYYFIIILFFFFEFTSLPLFRYNDRSNDDNIIKSMKPIGGGNNFTITKKTVNKCPKCGMKIVHEGMYNNTVVSLSLLFILFCIFYRCIILSKMWK